jgi:hypothetical protein
MSPKELFPLVEYVGVQRLLGSPSLQSLLQPSIGLAATIQFHPDKKGCIHIGLD